MIKLDKKLFEYVICKNAMFDAEYLSSIVDHYNPLYFDNEDVRCILSIIVDFFGKHNKIPNMTEIKVLLTDDTQKEHIRSLLAILKTIDDAKDYNGDELIENTEQFLRERAVYMALLRTTENLSNSNIIDTSAILETFNQACTISLVDDLGFDYFERVDDHLNDLNKPNNVIPIGWSFIDERIGGGIQAEGKALYVFTGFTNVGKSIFLGNIAMNIVKQNKVVLLISLEMSEQMYSKRISSSISQIPYSIIHEHVDELKTHIMTFKDNHNAKLIIKEFPTKGVTVNHLNSYISKLIKRGIKPDVLVVDYVNLFKSNKKNVGLYDEVKDIAEQLRGTTYKFKCPCITASQLGRSAAGVSEPGMEKTSESIGLPFTADAQFSIWSEEGDKQAGLIHLGIQKNRFGVNFGHTTLDIVYETLTIKERPIFTTMTNATVKSSDDTIDDIQKALSASKTPIPAKAPTSVSTDPTDPLGLPY
jgi:replicative DNA helicase